MILERDKEFYKKLIKIAIPISLQTLLTLGIGLVDSFMVGRLGDNSLSAVAIANQFCIIFQYIAMGLGNGGAVLTGQFYGGHNKRDIKHLVSYLYKISIIVALIFMIVTMIFNENIMGLYSKDVEVTVMAVGYLKIMIPTFIIMAINTISCCWLRSIGVVNVSMVSAGISFVVKVVANYGLIFGGFGLKALGVNGAAVATLVARSVECLIIIIYVLKFEKHIKFTLQDLKGHDKRIARMFLKKGQPVLYSDMMIALGQNGISMIMGNISTALLASSSIVTTVVQISALLLIDISGAAATISSNTIGAGKLDKAYSQGVTCAFISTVIGIINGILIFCTKEWIVSFYNISPEAKALTIKLLSVISIVVVFSDIGITLAKGILRGGGDTKYLMIIDVIFLWTVSIPLGYITGIYFKLDPWIVFVCMRLDEVIKCCVCIGRLKSKKWIKKI